MAQRTNLVAVAVPQKMTSAKRRLCWRWLRNVSGAFGVAIFSTVLD
jgi:hypothetical protein